LSTISFFFTSTYVTRSGKTGLLAFKKVLLILEYLVALELLFAVWL